jgi:hypothetical protein
MKKEQIVNSQRTTVLTAASLIFALGMPARSHASPLTATSSGTTDAITSTATGTARGAYVTADQGVGVQSFSWQSVAVYGGSAGEVGSGAGVLGGCLNCVGVVGESTNNEGMVGYGGLTGVHGVGMSDNSTGVSGTAFGANTTGVSGEGSWNGVNGVTSSTNPLTGGVHGATAGAGNGVFAENGGSGRGLYAVSATGNAIFASSGTTDAIVGYAGTGAGSTGIWGKAHGTGTYGVYSSGDLYVKGVTGSPGNAYKPGGGSWTATSDRRVKKDVQQFTPALAELAKVHPVRFKYNGLGGTADTGKEYVGVIAQDLEKVLPFMVSSQKRKLRESDRDVTEIKEVDPSAFTYVLINAVKELSTQNQQLAQQVSLLNAQTQRIDQLAQLICADHAGSKACTDARQLASASAPVSSHSSP